MHILQGMNDHSEFALGRWRSPDSREGLLDGFPTDIPSAIEMAVLAGDFMYAVGLHDSCMEGIPRIKTVMVIIDGGPGGSITCVEPREWHAEKEPPVRPGSPSSAPLLDCPQDFIHHQGRYLHWKSFGIHSMQYLSCHIAF